MAFSKYLSHSRNTLNTIFSDPGIFLHRLLRPCIRGQPALVPGRRGSQLHRDHLLLLVLPLSGRAAQQAPAQLVDGGVLVHGWGDFLLLHSLRVHPERVCWGGGRGVAVLDRC